MQDLGTTHLHVVLVWNAIRIGQMLSQRQKMALALLRRRKGIDRDAHFPQQLLSCVGFRVSGLRVSGLGFGVWN